MTAVLIIVIALFVLSAVTYYKVRSVMERMMLKRISTTMSDAAIAAAINGESDLYTVSTIGDQTLIMLNKDVTDEQLPQWMQEIYKWVTTHYYLPDPLPAGACDFGTSDLNYTAALAGQLLTMRQKATV